MHGGSPDFCVRSGRRLGAIGNVQSVRVQDVGEFGLPVARHGAVLREIRVDKVDSAFGSLVVARGRQVNDAHGAGLRGGAVTRRALEQR